MAIQLNFKCSESWDKMPNSDKGKFCDKCTKNVFDLTDKSDTEIKQIYTENNGKMCGRIKQSQLNMPFVSQHKQILAKFCAALYLVFGGLLFNHTANAQSIVANSENIVNEIDSNYYTIKGTLTEEKSGEPIPFANVYFEVNSQKYGTTTDFDGRYVLSFNKGVINKDSIKLVHRSLSYQTLVIKNLKFNNQGTVLIDAKMKEEEIILMGDVWFEEPPIINKDPEKHGETIIKDEEIKRSPY